MEKLKKMKECLVGMVESQIYGNIDKVNAEELGEAVDMIKDLSEAIYYCTITEAMKEGSEYEEGHRHKTMYYAPQPMMYYDPRYKERYPVHTSNSHNGDMNRHGSPHGGEWDHNDMVRYPETVDHIYRDGMMKDMKEGRSGERRKMYMESKGMKDKTLQMKELENYMQELSTDITEMIQDASMEEKQLLQQKIATLATKIK